MPEDPQVIGKAKVGKNRKEIQSDNDQIILKKTAEDNIIDNEGVKKKRRRRKPKTTENVLENQAVDFMKDKSQIEQDLLQANLYINEKNKSLEKESKLSYGETISDVQQTPRKTRESHAKRGDDTRKTRGLDTIVSAEKARRRLKTRTKQADTDGVDGTRGDHMGLPGKHEGSPGTIEDRIARENDGFVDGDDTRETGTRQAHRTEGRRRARENMGFDQNDDEDLRENSAQQGETSTVAEKKKKTGKKRKKKLKETSAEIMQRALETKRKDDGHVLCVIIHKADRLKTDLRISHPLVRVHIVDMETGKYVKKCSRNRAVTSYYENQETIDHVLPLMTEPFDFKQRKSLIPNWEDVLIINEIYSYFLQREEDDPKVIIFFEVLDFLSVNAITKLKGSQNSDRGWYRIAWAFLKLVGSNGAPNTDTKVRLQLYYPVASQRRNISTSSDTPEVYNWWLTTSRVPYPSTLYITVKGVRPPKHIDAAGRSMFAIQEEKGRSTLDELTDKAAGGGLSPRNTVENSVAWSKLPGQPNHIPNQLMSTLQAGRRGCFVVKFSHDGRKLACACAEKENFSVYIFETLSSRCTKKLQGHFSIIYDVCWSHDDKELISGSSDGTARCWATYGKANSPTKLFPHPCFVYAVRYHPTRGNIVVTGGYDRLLRIWNKESNDMNGQLLREIEGHEGFINTICFDPSGQFMYSGDSVGIIIVWNTFENSETKKTKKNRSTSHEGVFNWVISKTIKEPEFKDCIINSLRLHPNGRKLLVHTRDSLTRMIDLRSFSVMTRYIGSSNFKEHIRSTLTTCGSYVLSGSEDGQVHVWDTESGEIKKIYSDLGYSAAVSDVDFHPHDDIVAFCSFGENHPVLLYKYETTNSKVDVTSSSTAVAMSGANTTTAQKTNPVSTIPLVHTLGESTRPINNGTSATQPLATMATQRTPSMADVASETILLNKIKKKLDSVLEVSANKTKLQTNFADSLTLSPGRSLQTPTSQLESQQQRPLAYTFSTWGSEFSDTAYDTMSRSETVAPQTHLQPIRTTISTSSTPARQDTVGIAENSSSKVQAMYSFKGRVGDELSFEDGQIISVLRDIDQNWAYGETSDGRRGYFPKSYVVPCSDITSKKKGKSNKQSNPRKHYTAVKTDSGDVKIVSAPEESDNDIVVTTRRSRTAGRSSRDSRSSAKKRLPNRTKDESRA